MNYQPGFQYANTFSYPKYRQNGKMVESRKKFR
jgi:hypothetical protein